MAPPILILRDIHLTFGGTPLLTGAELAVSEGECLCVVGRNGSGKSTLVRIAAGAVEADDGERFVQPGTTMRYLSQEPDLSGHATTLDFVKSGLGPGDDPHSARHLLERLGLNGEEDPMHLSGGEARRAALAQALAPKPDILLLDEPTNHLDLPTIEWLEDELRNARSALVLISHDRRFLENLSRSTAWIDRGVVRRIDRGFKHFEEWRDKTLEEEEIERHKLDRKLAMEADWLRYGVTARRKRNQGRLRALQSLRKEKAEQRKAVGGVKMTVTEGKTSGKLVFEAVGTSKSFDEKSIVRDFSLKVMRGDRIGLVGPNGAGKTTILNVLTGELKPDAGAVRRGANVELVTLDQRRESLDPGLSLKEALTGGGDMVFVGGGSKHVMSYMKDFLFSPEQAGTPIERLSGGERGRLMLARALARPSNVLVLDEPTNDLDLETLDLLQEMLSEYQGTVILVSHDRDFLDRVVTSVVAFEGEGRWLEYAGGYSDMVAQRGHGVEGAAQTASPERKRGPKPKSASSGNGPAKRRMSYKEKFALESLPGKMEALEAEILALRKELDDPDLFTRDPERFKQAAADLEMKEGELSASEEEWLALELLREEIENS